LRTFQEELFATSEGLADLVRNIAARREVDVVTDFSLVELDQVFDLVFSENEVEDVRGNTLNTVSVGELTHLENIVVGQAASLECTVVAVEIAD
jgi:hypothetical protein